MGWGGRRRDRLDGRRGIAGHGMNVMALRMAAHRIMMSGFLTVRPAMAMPQARSHSDGRGQRNHRACAEKNARVRER